MKNKMNKLLAFILAISLGTAIFPLSPIYAEEFIVLTDDDDEEIKLTDENNDTKDGKSEAETEEIVEPVQEEVKTISRSHSKAYTLLRNLAIIEDDYETEQIVTRGEFAAVLTRMLGITDGKVKVFKDVLVRTANSKAIGVVTEKGLMSADDEGYFRPKDALTMDDAAKALLKLAGYDQIISKYGGESIGYSQIAGQNGWVSDKADGSMTWGKTAETVYKALRMEVISIGNFSTKDLSYKKSSTTLLGLLYGLDEATGYVSATAYAALKNRPVTNNRHVTITSQNGDYTYDSGITDIQDKLGYDVTIYFYDGDAGYTIAAYVLNDDLEELEIKEQDYLNVNSALSEIQYSKGSGTKRVRLESDAAILYNNAMCYAVSKADFDNADSIHMIDTDGNGLYDVCNITSYDVYLVDSFSDDYGIVSDKREGISFTIDDDNYDVVVKKYGFEVDRNVISEWDILRVAVTKAGSSRNLMTILISSDTVTGNVTSASSSDRSVKLDGEEYYVKKTVNMTDMFGNIAAGVDEDSKIICFIKDTVNTDRRYGYISKFYMTYGDGGQEVISAYFMDDSGKFVTIPLAEKFRINNQKMDWNDICTALDDGTSGGTAKKIKAKEQLFAYTTDENGAIKKMYFAINPATGLEVESGAIDPVEANQLILNKKFSAPRVWDSYGTVNGEYVYNSKTKSFSVVTDDDGHAIEELSGVFTPGNLRFSSISRVDSGSRPSLMYCYDAGVARTCGAVLAKISYSNINNFSPEAKQVFIVDKVYTTIDKNDEVVDKVDGVYAGSKISFSAGELTNINVKTWQKGDAYFIRLTTDGKLLTAKKVFSLTDTSVISPARDYTGLNPVITEGTTYNATGSATTAFAESTNLMYGRVQSVTSDSIRLRPINSANDVVYKYSSTKVYIYDTESEELSLSTVSAITKGMGTGNAFMYARYGFARDILIIK